MNEQTQMAERTRLGDNCKAAQGIADKAESELADSDSMINSWRSKKQGYLTELEILNAKDPDTLDYDLRMRKLDLEKDADELTGFIDRSLKSQQTMKHSIEMAGLGLTMARDAYTDFTSGSDGITNSQIREMQSIPRTSPQMTEQRRAKIISAMGMDFYNSIPMT